MLCSATQFSVLPEAGGLYDQHPGFLEAMEYILIEQQKWENSPEKKRQEAREQQTMGTHRAPRPRRVAGR